MFAQIKKFLKYIRNDISKSFFYSQAAIDEILKDRIYSIFRCRTNKFKIINGIDKNFEDEKNDLLIFFNEKLSSISSIDHGLDFSKRLNIENTPNIFLRIFKNHQNEIKKYLGGEILIDKPLIWRNYNIDSKLSGYDIYSNVWHQDSGDGNRMLKIFVLLDDVNNNDGPFHWLNEEQTKANWDQVCDRWTFNVFKGVQKIPDENKLIGKSGSYLILDTSRCMHRASIPNNHRTMLQLTMHPKWRRKVGRYNLNF